MNKSYFQEPEGVNPKYPCGICNKIIAKNHKYVRCSICNYKLHIKCNKTDYNTYKKMNKNDKQVCLKCKNEAIPFQAINDLQFFATIKNGINNNEDIIDNLNDTIPS